MNDLWWYLAGLATLPALWCAVIGLIPAGRQLAKWRGVGDE